MTGLGHHSRHGATSFRNSVCYLCNRRGLVSWWNDFVHLHARKGWHLCVSTLGGDGHPFRSGVRSGCESNTKHDLAICQRCCARKIPQICGFRTGPHDRDLGGFGGFPNYTREGLAVIRIPPICPELRIILSCCNVFVWGPNPHFVYEYQNGNTSQPVSFIDLVEALCWFVPGERETDNKQMEPQRARVCTEQCVLAQRNFPMRLLHKPCYEQSLRFCTQWASWVLFILSDVPRTWWCRPRIQNGIFFSF